MELSRKKNETAIQSSLVYDLIVVFILFHFFGFPGKFTRVFGDKIETLIDFGCFGLELATMIMSSGDTAMDIKLLDLKAKYRPMYVYVVYIFVTGVMLSTDRKAEVITCTRLVALLSFSIWAMERYSPQQFLELAYMAQILIVLANLFMMVRYSGIAYGYYEGAKAFTGINGAKNSTASELAFGVLLQMTLLRIKLNKQEPVSTFFVGMLGVQLVLLVLTKGTGALLTTCMSVFYVFVMEKRLGESRRIPLGFLNVLLSIGFLLFALTIIPMFEPILESLGKDATLTGRIPLWERIITITMENRPLTGFGYERLWKETVSVDLIHAGFASTSWFAKMTAGGHSVLVELLGSTGILGLGLYYLMIILCFRNIPYMTEEQYLYVSAIMLVYTLHGLTERGMSPTSYYTLFFFTTLSISCSAEKKKPERRRRNLE